MAVENDEEQINAIKLRVELLNQSLQRSYQKGDLSRKESTASLKNLRDKKQKMSDEKAALVKKGWVFCKFQFSTLNVMC